MLLSIPSDPSESSGPLQTSPKTGRESCGLHYDLSFVSLKDGSGIFMGVIMPTGIPLYNQREEHEQYE